MLGESLEKFIRKNKRTRIEEAKDCLAQLRGFSRDKIIENPWEYLEILTLLIGFINEKNPFAQISLEDIGTTEEEIRYFEENSLIAETKTF